MTAYLSSALFVVLAEMGDKTQLLAMAFATRYCWKTVMWGVFAATVLNHLFAVIVGKYLTHIVPIEYIQLGAAFSFILFGLWTIRGDELCGEDRECGRSPFWTVAIAFFIAEMGDKTQLATVALAAQFNAIVPIWLGTTTGMMIADGIGIVIGIVLGRRIPERLVKWVAAVIFIGVGIYGLYCYLPPQYVSIPYAAAGLTVIGLLIYAAARCTGEKCPRGQE